MGQRALSLLQVMRSKPSCVSLLVGLLVCIFLLGGCGGTRQAGEAIPGPDPPVTVTERTDPPPMPASRLSAMVMAGEVSSIRLVGDSITAGVGCDGYGEETDKVIYQGSEGTFLESAPSVSCWANDLRAWADRAGITAVTNAGIAGARMSWLADEPEAWLGDGADVIIVMLGTNDAVWSDASAFEEDARHALAAADEASDLLVVLSPPMNARTDGRAQFGMDEVDRVLTAICDERGYEHATLLDAVAPDDGTLCDDLIHPTSAGSHAMWASLCSQLGIGE